ncbi:MAG TPA: hypothetical protein PKK11_06480 [Methanothrix sp.]|nr:hypothetical protein [Methanothrix sp.]
MPCTDWQFIGGIAVTLPLLSEQSAAVLLDHMNRRIICCIRARQLLIRKYRARLISDVVTGKLDVRGIDLPATEDTEIPEEYTDLLDSDEVIEDEELQDELPAEGN